MIELAKKIFISPLPRQSYICPKKVFTPSVENEVECSCPSVCDVLLNEFWSFSLTEGRTVLAWIHLLWRSSSKKEFVTRFKILLAKTYKRHGISFSLLRAMVPFSRVMSTPMIRNAPKVAERGSRCSAHGIPAWMWVEIQSLEVLGYRRPPYAWGALFRCGWPELGHCTIPISLMQWNGHTWGPWVHWICSSTNVEIGHASDLCYRYSSNSSACGCLSCYSCDQFQWRMHG